MEARFPFGEYAQQALLESAYAHYKNDEPESAIATLDRFMRVYPLNPNMDYALYLHGLVNVSRDIGWMEKYIPGWWSIFGFVACVLIIILSKWFGHQGIMTREDYYD